VAAGSQDGLGETQSAGLSSVVLGQVENVGAPKLNMQPLGEALPGWPCCQVPGSVCPCSRAALTVGSAGAGNPVFAKHPSLLRAIAGCG